MAAESAAMVEHTVAKREVHVRLVKPGRFDSPDGRRFLVTDIKITDGYADTEFSRQSSGSRVGRTVHLSGWNIRRNGSVGQQTTGLLFSDGNVFAPLDGMPDWLVEIVDSACRYVREQSAGDR